MQSQEMVRTGMVPVYVCTNHLTILPHLLHTHAYQRRLRLHERIRHADRHVALTRALSDSENQPEVR